MNSVTHFNSPTAPHTSPHLPPEIWLTIFNLVTDVPSLLNCNGPSDLPRTLVKAQEQRCWKESLITKRSIILVCKAWHALTTEFLYQSILVTRVATLPLLLYALDRSSSGTSFSSSPGWWTKRLDVFIQDDRCEASDYALLAGIIRQFPNLSMISLSMPMLPYNDHWLRQLPKSVVMALVESCGSSLRVFDCSESILRPCREDLMMLLAATPNLSVLCCPICSPSTGDKSPSVKSDVPIMANLRSVSLMSVFLRDFLPSDKQANHFPALRQLTYDCTPPFFDNTWKRFVKLSCSGVTSVSLDFSLQGDSLQQELDLLTECCPSLNRLAMYLRSWTEIKPNLILPPSVSHLGLHSKLFKPPTFHFQHLFTALHTITGSKLKSVRLLHADAVDDLRENHQSFLANELAGITSCIAFCIEDHEGRPLVA